MFEFTLEGTDQRARAGRFSTPHGELLTPVFAPVGTAATVKALTPAQVEELGARGVGQGLRGKRLVGEFSPRLQ